MSHNPKNAVPCLRVQKSHAVFLFLCLSCYIMAIQWTYFWIYLAGFLLYLGTLSKTSLFGESSHIFLYLFYTLSGMFPCFLLDSSYVKIIDLRLLLLCNIIHTGSMILVPSCEYDHLSYAYLSS